MTRSPHLLAALAALLVVAACDDSGGSTAAGQDTTTSTSDTMGADTSTGSDTSTSASDTATPMDSAGPSDTTTAADTTAPVDTIAPAGCDPTGAPFGGTVTLPDIGDASLICSAAQLDAIRTAPTGVYALASDVDLTGTPWLPIEEFQGVLAGQDHHIIGLNLDCSPQGGATEPAPNCGFVRFLTNGGVLSDLRFTEVATSIVPSGGTVAAVVRGAQETDLGKAATPGAFVRNVHVAGHVSIDGSASGGVFRVTLDGALIEDVSFTGTLAHPFNPSDSAANIGGLAWRFGGDTSVRGASFSGRIEGPGSSKMAGLAAEAVTNAHIDGCAVDLTLHGRSEVAGLVHTVSHSTIIENCRVTGAISVTDTGGRTAGLVGTFNGGTLKRSYLAATVSSPMDSIDLPPLINWRVNDHTTVFGLRYDAELNVDSEEDGLGLTTAEMQDPDHAAWDEFGSPWVLAAGAYPTLDLEADVPSDLDQPPTFACGEAGLTCTVGAEGCVESIPDCAAPSFSCSADGAGATVAFCLAYYPNPCDCLLPQGQAGDGWSCAVNSDGDVEATVNTICEAVEVGAQKQ